MRSRFYGPVKLCLLALGVALMALPAHAQFPDKRLTVIVPYSPGGGLDILARILAKDLGEAIKQPVIVENAPGADGIIGTQRVIRSEPDGYTLLFTSAAVGINPMINASASYNALRDLQPVARMASIPYIITTSANVPAKNLGELIAYMKSRGNMTTFGNGGTTITIGAAVLRLTTGVDFTEVPYKGNAPVVLAISSGEIDATIFDFPSIAGRTSDGRIRPIAVTGNSRISALPDVPTSKEAGFPDVLLESWFAMFAPAGTPAEVVRKLNQEMNKISKHSEVQNRIASLGGVIISESVKEFETFYKNDMQRWQSIIDRAGIKKQN